MTKDRFDLTGAKATMKAVVTTGNGGYDQLVYRDVPVPELKAGEVLVQVLAAGVNNTEINTRLGWYSAAVTEGTAAVSSEEKERAKEAGDGGWNEATPFPFIQGTDCCGRVVVAASDKDARLTGSRVLIRPCIRRHGWGSLENIWMASDFDGAFAQFVKINAAEVFPVDCDWTDAELGTIPCAYGTAENMIHRTRLAKGEHIVIPGASGGVGSALVQLAKRRGAHVTAIAGKDKIDRVKELGADVVIARGENLLRAIGEKTADVVIDNVGGPDFPLLLQILKRGGRYASSGAIAGPVVALDLRTFYLKDITLIGCTAWDEPVFPNLVSYIQKGEIKPLLERTFPLENIVDAQKLFLEKKHVGKLVLIPPAMNAEQVAYFEPE